MTRSIDDLLGASVEPSVTPPRRRRRAPAPPKIEEIDLETVDLSDLPDSNAVIRQNAIKLAGSGRAFVELGVLKRPVSKNFLALLFDMDPATVTKRLLNCPEEGRAGGGRPMYDFRTAIAFLIPPKMDIGEYIESLDPNELPNHINRAYWGAIRERRRALLELGEAWHTEDVMHVVGRLMMTLTGWAKLLPDQLRETCRLSDEQFDGLTKAVDGLQTELHQTLVDNAKNQHTASMLSDHVEPGDGAA